MPKTKTVVEFSLQWYHYDGFWKDVMWGPIWSYNNYARTWRYQYLARRAAQKMRLEWKFCRNQKSKPKKFRIVKKTSTTEIVERVGT
jgi:hypothetical protein